MAQTSGGLLAGKVAFITGGAGNNTFVVNDLDRSIRVDVAILGAGSAGDRRSVPATRSCRDSRQSRRRSAARSASPAPDTRDR